ncbi:hypothetical protein F66182_9391 [Fusarium sp. NRRL 66182]|nr:hypothetical protein F66182_9391 [Fusarium sp. NRRL 66182]
MKLSLTLAGLIGLAAASPFSEHDTSGGLQARGRKCNWKDQSCCAYPDQYRDAPYKEPKNYYGYSRTIHVKPGKNAIQKAIRKASPGDRIVVGAGTYAEQVVIDKDGIQLEGRGAILVKPATYVTNECTGLTKNMQGQDTQTGICITGYKVKKTAFVTEHVRVESVKRYIKGVSVSGFTVQDFSGVNIAVVGARNTRVSNNKLIDGNAYGGLTIGSYNTVFSENVVSATKPGFIIGICMDNKSDVLAKKNDISSQFIGLCVQTNGAVLEHNTLSHNCIGIFIDPGVKNAKVRHNKISESPAACGDTGSGIILGSAIGTLVSDNTITKMRTASKRGVGILIYDDTCVATETMPLSLSCIVLGGPVKASDNVVIRNKLSDNDSDIVNFSQGTGNVIKCNTCENPANIQAGQCKKP